MAKTHTLKNKSKNQLKDTPKPNSIERTKESIWKSEGDFREELEAMQVHGQKSPFVRSLLNESARQRTDCIGLLIQVFSPGRFLPIYWFRFGLPDLAKEVAELEFVIKNRITSLRKVLSEDEFKRFVNNVDEILLQWQAWRKRAIDKGMQDISEFMAWAEWSAENADLKGEWDDISEEIYELQEYLQKIALVVDERINSIVGGGEKTKPTKARGGEEKREPLSDNQAAIYELLKELPEHKAMTGKEILKKLEGKGIIIDQSTLTKNIIPALRPYGVKNKRGAGYYISK